MKQLDVKELDENVRAASKGRRLKASSFLRGIAQLALAIAVLAAGFGGYRFLLANKQPVFQRPAQEQVWAVETVPVAYSSHRPVLKLYGEAVAARKVEMRALVPGTIVGIGPNLNDGGIVAKGDVLVEIDAFDYRGALVEARANLQEAQARLAEREALIALQRDALVRAEEQLTIARRDHERALELSKGGTLSEKSVDDRRLVLSQREQAVEQIKNNTAAEQARADQQRAQIERLQWRVEQAERDLADTTLRAPFDAYVSNVNAEVGRSLTANDVVAVLLDRADTEVRVTLTDRQYGRIIAESGSVTGRPVEVVWSLGKTESVHSGTIVRVAAEIAAERGGVDVFARVDTDKSASALRPGAFVEVRVADRTYENAVRLPETALYDGDTVYVVTGDRVEARKVELLGGDADAIFVTGELKEGEAVVTTRVSEIGDGLKVEVQN